MTFEEVDALTMQQLNDALCEFVMGWTRNSLTAEIVDARGKTQDLAVAWIETTNNKLRLWTVTPDFTTNEHFERVLLRMRRQGFTLELMKAGGDSSALYYRNGLRPATPQPFVRNKDEESIMRAALLAATA